MPETGKQIITRTERVTPDSLAPYPGNARRGDVALVAESLKTHGQYRAIVVQESTGYVLAGNHTLEAAKSLGWETIEATFVDVDDVAARKINLVDNRANDVAFYDEPALAELLADLEGDYEGTGFSGDDLDAMMAGFGSNSRDADAVPDPPDDPITQVGDVVKLGKHRLVCGDATDRRAVEAALEGYDPVQVVFTDPPYNLAFDGGREGKWLAPGSSRPQGLKLVNDDLPAEAYEQLLNDAFLLLLDPLTTQSGVSLYVCCDWRCFPAMRTAVEQGAQMRSVIAWDKGNIGLGYAIYRPRYELIIYATAGGPDTKPAVWHGGNSEADVWEITREAGGRHNIHITQKPVALIERALVNSSERDGVVFDPFAGSGSTIIAAERKGRVAAAIELDPRYCDAIIARWEKYSGKEVRRP